MKNRFEVVVDQEHCKACGFCVKFCPKDVLAFSEERNVVGFYPVEVKNADACIGCTQCAEVCPDGCIEIYRLVAEEVDKQ